MTRVGAVVIAALIAAASVAGCGRTAEAERIDALLARASKSGPFDGVVLVAVRGTIVYEGAKGLSAPAPTIDGALPLASLARPFTAMAVLLLERDGRLSLDDPVTRYVPELPGFVAPVTLRHLLDHTSGIEDYRDAEGLARPGLGNRDVLAWVGESTALGGLPGKRFVDSATDDVLLAAAVERVAHRPFATYLREAILAPLGMTRTRVVEADDASLDGLGATTGDGGMVGSARDLLRWDRALADGKAWPQPDPQGRSTAYGWNFLRLGGERVAYQAGTVGDHGAVLWRDLVGGTTVVVLARGDAARLREVANGVLAILDRGALRVPR